MTSTIGVGFKNDSGKKLVMKVLDLFCGAGGAAAGIALARLDVDITGVDINRQPDYPFEFVQADAMQLGMDGLHGFDFIWASPPCQGYSWGTVKWRNQGKKYPDLVAATRKLLDSSGIPYCMENVVGAPLRRDLMLCGEMFGLKVIRHRIFECSGFKPVQIPHQKHRNAVWNGTAIGVWSGGKPGCYGNVAHRKYYVTAAGHGGNAGKGNCTLKAWQEAMGIDWVASKDSLKECVPPAYSNYIFSEFLRLLDEKSA